MSAPPVTIMAPPGHITSPNEPYPSPAHLAAATRMHSQGRFTVSTRKLPISKAGPIDAMATELGIPVPEMIFGDNLVAVRHGPTGFGVEFCARDALDAVDKTGEHMLQVAYARDWSASRERTSAGIKEVVKPYDWSYSTTYKGTVTTTTTTSAADGTAQGAESSSPALSFAPTDVPIPLELLKRRDPILFFDEVMLYESELDDNGISVFSVKLRVHERRMLLLCRLFMRLDGVLVRIRDTRIYVDFDTDIVTREYTAKEGKFEDVKKALFMTGLLPDTVTIAMRDANKIADLLPVVEQTLESVSLAS
ncbi:TIP41-like family-domain-containing protein [Xylariales sp. PMI_506]|nr:TIP41-like family-domain-containing protein [Xylariales sp. PMI_506]